MLKQKKINYSDRINQIAAMIEPGASVIDIGTDHAYLAIALLDNSRSTKVLAIDSNEKPYKKALYNINLAGYQDAIDLRLNQDLEGIDITGEETIVMTGLGGVLISKILEKNRSKFTSKTRFLLQPNWTWYDLRKYLASAGFKIKQEKILNDQGRLYSLLDVSYTDKKYKISDYEAYVGLNHKITSNEYIDYLNYLKRLARLSRKKAQGSKMYTNINRQLMEEINDYSSNDL